MVPLPFSPPSIPLPPDYRRTLHQLPAHLRPPLRRPLIHQSLRNTPSPPRPILDIPRNRPAPRC